MELSQTLVRQPIATGRWPDASFVAACRTSRCLNRSLHRKGGGRGLAPQSFTVSEWAVRTGLSRPQAWRQFHQFETAGKGTITYRQGAMGRPAMVLTIEAMLPLVRVHDFYSDDRLKFIDSTAVILAGAIVESSVEHTSTQCLQRSLRPTVAQLHSWENGGTGRRNSMYGAAVNVEFGTRVHEAPASSMYSARYEASGRRARTPGRRGPVAHPPRSEPARVRQPDDVRGLRGSADESSAGVGVTCPECRFLQRLGSGYRTMLCTPCRLKRESTEQEAKTTKLRESISTVERTPRPTKTIKRRALGRPRWRE